MEKNKVKPTIIPMGRFLDPESEPAKKIGRIGKIQGEIIKQNPSINPKIILIKFASILFPELAIHFNQYLVRSLVCLQNSIAALQK
ncbi:hypothetical protein [Legionella sp. WA2022007384]